MNSKSIKDEHVAISGENPHSTLTVENPHSTLKARASTFYLAPFTVHKIWKQANYHHYKRGLIHEDDFKR